jgi:8-oxo-dGTP pyrophosphatase MutT (NUDIX family)
MRPSGVESNHFAYHLEQLAKTGIVVKDGRQYALAPAGLILVDRLSQGKMVDRLQPHIVTAIEVTANNGQTLLFKRAFQPYINRVGFPLGKIHFEETIQEAALRELEEKTGLTDVILTHRGVVYLESKIKGTAISKVMYHLFQGRVADPSPVMSSERGSCIWSDDKVLKDHELMPGFRSMKKLLANEPGFFFAELSEEQVESPS